MNNNTVEQKPEHTMIIECDNCNAVMQTQIVGSFDNNPGDLLENVLYTFCKCPQCLSPILARQIRSYDGFELYWDKPTKLYPNNSFYINPIIPEQLRRALLECIQCHRANAHTATAIMCRRTLEGFCLIKGVEERNLAKAISKLKEQGSINEQLYEWANQLRLVGNEAAHNISSEFTALDSKDILEFTIAILDFTYSFKDKFDKFKIRLNKAKD